MEDVVKLNWLPVNKNAELNILIKIVATTSVLPAIHYIPLASKDPLERGGISSYCSPLRSAFLIPQPPHVYVPLVEEASPENPHTLFYALIKEIPNF